MGCWFYRFALFEADRSGNGVFVKPHVSATPHVGLTMWHLSEVLTALLCPLHPCNTSMIPTNGDGGYHHKRGLQPLEEALDVVDDLTKTARRCTVGTLIELFLELTPYLTTDMLDKRPTLLPTETTESVTVSVTPL